MDSHQKNDLVLVSACLTGINCTFRKTNNLNSKVRLLADKKLTLVLCPEVAGSLGVPRENIELVGGDGYDVLDGSARAITASGRDVTKEVVAGAKKVLEAARKLGVKKAILKARSPTCGSGLIFDGTFSRKLCKGDGVLAALLKRNDISVKTDEET